MLSNNPLNPHGVGWVNFFRWELVPYLSAHACQIWSRSDGRVEKGGFMIMKLLQVCQVQYCQQCVNFYYVGYNTANNASTFGGDPVTQLIVNVYQMIKL